MPQKERLPIIFKTNSDYNWDQNKNLYSQITYSDFKIIIKINFP